MKDEEMAEKYKHYSNNTELQTAYEWGYKDGFIAGLHEGQPNWHDLRKDPNDLPKKNKFYWVYMDCQGNKTYRSVVWQGCWCTWNGVVLAWCEEPQFKE